MIVYKVIRRLSDGRRISAIDGPINLYYEPGKRVRAPNKMPIFAYQDIDFAMKFAHLYVRGPCEVWACRARKSDRELPKLILDTALAREEDIISFWNKSKKELERLYELTWRGNYLPPSRGTVLVRWLELKELIFVRRKNKIKPGAFALLMDLFEGMIYEE